MASLRQLVLALVLGLSGFGEDALDARDVAVQGFVRMVLPHVHVAVADAGGSFCKALHGDVDAASGVGGVGVIGVQAFALGGELTSFGG